MTARAQWTVVAATLGVLAVGLFVAVKLLGSELFPVSLGSRAPDFTAVTLDGVHRTKGIHDYDGQVVLLNVWATWCEPCRVEMPSIEALHKDFAPSGLKVVAVSIDKPGSEKGILDFARDMHLSFEMLHNPAGDIQKIYQTTGVPETFIIGRDGVIRKKMIGADNWSTVGNRALIAQLLSEGSGAADRTPAALPNELRDSTSRVTVPARR